MAYQLIPTVWQRIGIAAAAGFVMVTSAFS
jgi:hypothetical protein